jgi:hypothetical protein
MVTATPAPSKPEHHTAAGHAPELEIDPDHDIDAKKTIIVLGLSTVFVFGSVFLLYILFSMVIHDQRVTHFEQAPTPEVEALRAYEAGMLEAGEDPKRKSIQDSIRELSTK